ncbi:MAG TPA: hypothetical protein VMW19_00700 [Myxococcota bacterium]|nr:hypothetical protein [Myxococcota bacterium]
MIRFLVTRGHERTLKHARRDASAPRIETLAYDRVFAERRLARALYVFTDHDRLSAFDLELAALVHRSLATAGVPVWNDPARVRTRFALLRALHEAGLNDFNVYRADEGLKPARFPVFLRRAAGHGAPVSGLLPDPSALARAVETALAQGVPESSLLIVEYAAEPARPGIFRKLAVSRIGPRLLPQACVHDDDWLVKYGKVGVGTPELYADERRILRDNPYAETAERAFEIAGIDYGRADLGLLRGRVQVYEINTNPTLRRGLPHPDPQRSENLARIWDAHLEALRALDPGPLPGAPVALDDPRLRRHQGWLDRYVRRSRETP